MLVSGVPKSRVLAWCGVIGLPERGGKDVGETVDAAVLVAELSEDEDARDSDEVVDVLGSVEMMFSWIGAEEAVDSLAAGILNRGPRRV